MRSQVLCWTTFCFAAMAFLAAEASVVEQVLMQQAVFLSQQLLKISWTGRAFLSIGASSTKQDYMDETDN